MLTFMWSLVRTISVSHDYLGMRERTKQRREIQENANCGAVVKNPLSPVEHLGGEGVANELFELALDQFVKGVL
jgi:hypothetical protein